MNNNQKKYDATQQATTGPCRDLVDSPNSDSAPPFKVMRWHRIRQVLGHVPSQSQGEPETPRPGPDRRDSYRHNYTVSMQPSSNVGLYGLYSQTILTEYGKPSSHQLSSVHGNVETGRSHMLPLLPGSPFEMCRSRSARMSTRNKLHQPTSIGASRSSQPEIKRALV